MQIPEWLILCAGPVIGAVIGLLTNWVAVKMLFRPRKAHYIGKFHIPFTPGVIPRRQGALAKALGQAVSETLVRREDLKESLCSDAVADTVVNTVMALPSVRTLGTELFGTTYESKRMKVLDFATDRILAGILSLDLGEVITNEAKTAIAAFADTKMVFFRSMVNDQMIASITEPITGKVIEYLQTAGRDRLYAALEEQAAVAEGKPVAELFANPEAIRNALLTFYRDMVRKYADKVLEHIRIEEIVEQKIAAMDSKDLETLVLSVMKKELNYLIWLGVPIGFIMGCITTLITHFGGI